MDMGAKKLVSLCGLPGKSFLQNLFTVWAREAQIGVGRAIRRKPQPGEMFATPTNA